LSDLKAYSNSLEDTLKDSDLHNIGVGLSEVAIDNLMDGVAKDIPIISTILSVGKVALGVRDRLFLKKIIHFISEVKDIPAEDRKEIIDKINNSSDYRVKVGEKLLYIIDRCDDYEKAKLIARMFSAFVSGEINYNEFLRSSSIIDRLMIEDIVWFIDNGKDLYQWGELGDLVNSGLFSINIVNPADGDLKFPDGTELHASITDIGEKMLEVLKLC
jgi:hypothetical protein